MKEEIQVIRTFAKIAEIVSLVIQILCGVVGFGSVAGFMPVIVISKNISVEAGGFLGMLIDAFAGNVENSVGVAEVFLALLPKIVLCLIAFFFFGQLRKYCKKLGESNEVFFIGSHIYPAKMAVSAFLMNFIPGVISVVAEKVLPSEVFNIERTDSQGFVILGFILIFTAFVFRYGEGLENAENHNRKGDIHEDSI